MSDVFCSMSDVFCVILLVFVAMSSAFFSIANVFCASFSSWLVNLLVASCLNCCSSSAFCVMSCPCCVTVSSTASTSD